MHVVCCCMYRLLSVDWLWYAAVVVLHPVLLVTQRVSHYSGALPYVHLIGRQI